MLTTLHSSVPGRVRLNVPSLYRSKSLQEHLETYLSCKEDIIGVRASVLTANVIILHNSNRNLQEIFELVSEAVRTYRTISTTDKNDHAPSKSTSHECPSCFSSQTASEKINTFKEVATKKVKRLVSNAHEQLSLPWHSMELQDVAEKLGLSPGLGQCRPVNGLCSDEVQKRLGEYGQNILPEAEPRSVWSMLFDQVNSIPVALLAVAAGISAVTGGLIDAAIILGVVCLNAAIGYVTEAKSEKTINSLKNLVRPTALVQRDGKTIEIGAEDVVPGDLLLLRPGHYVAADARIIEAKRLTIDESALTGESVPSLKTSEALRETNTPLSDRMNMCYMGTLITGGQGMAVVVATGKFTEVGRIQMLIGSSSSPKTPMEEDLDQIGTKLVVISGVLCAIVFFVGLLRGYGFLQMLKTAISLAVAAVPEGLPTVATTTLALGISAMKKQKTLIRHLEAVEALGSVQVLCMDKTGTITYNRMMVKELCFTQDRYSLDERALPSMSTTFDIAFADEVSALVVSSILCNESEVIKNNSNFVVNGTPTENALIYMAMKTGLDVPELQEVYPRVGIIHRSERRNFMATIHHFGNGQVSPHHPDGLHDKVLIAIKGSPSEVLGLCSTFMESGKINELSDDDVLDILTENERMGGHAFRMLGFAYAIKDASLFQGQKEDALLKDLCWLGLLGMTDPVRPGVSQLLEQLHCAGIKTVMITGDQSPTAYAIGKSINISGTEQLQILDSTGINDVDTEALSALASNAHVFSRVSPANKLHIVKALQASGKVVAMTGDGINDSPALKAANIGIAMGGTGTDVAREVADVILEDDNLETVIMAVAHGRTIYDNVRKSVRFLLATNFSEIIVSFISNMAGFGQPLTEMQLLWINLITDIFPGLALSFEEPEPDVLLREPRDPAQPIITNKDMKQIAIEAGAISIASLGAYGYGIARYGVGRQASTMSFLSIIIGQVLHTLSCRSEHHSIFDKQSLPPNRYVTSAVVGSFVLQGLALAVPSLRSLLGIGSIGIIDGAVVAGASVLPFLFNESRKKITGSSL